MEKVTLKDGRTYNFPDIYEYDDLGLVYNGGNFLYTKGKRKWTCPVCKKKTLDEPGGNCDCPICGWEDDICDLNHPDFALNENGVSYNQAVQLWEKYHDNIHNHEDEFVLSFGIPDIDKWIQENAGKITEKDLREKIQEHYGISNDDFDIEDEAE